MEFSDAAVPHLSASALPASRSLHLDFSLQDFEYEIDNVKFHRQAKEFIPDSEFHHHMQRPFKRKQHPLYK
jgi:hypothetical protein